MKALSLYQPYGTLVVLREKKIETRSWPTRYRGRLAIHASKTFPKWCKLLMRKDPFFSVLYNAGYAYPEAHARGAILCFVDLVDCLPVKEIPSRMLRDQERAFGDYNPGRFGWLLENVRKLEHPIPARGAMGLWDWNGQEPCPSCGDTVGVCECI